MRVKKRDGAFQQFEETKVQRALLMAFQSCRENPDVMPMVHRVVDRIRGEEEPVDIERVSDVIESVLVSAGYPEVGRGFMRYRIERERVRAERMRAPDGVISGYIHVGKYARYIEDLGRREVFNETVHRDMGMHVARWPDLESEIEHAFQPVFLREGMPSMRSMQFGGRAIEKNNERLYNCSFMHISRWRRFSDAFYLLLCGAGVGYSVQYRHVEQLSEVGVIDRGDVCHHTIADTIEGWADALGYLLESYWGERKCHVEFNYSLIRPEGTPLKTSGGKAPGHLPLKKCLEAVRALMDQAQGRKLMTLEASDVLCLSAEAVLAGGIRRASLLGLFSEDDSMMMYSKAAANFLPTGMGDVNTHREMVNISVALLRSSARRETFNRAMRVAESNFGCPGFYFTENLDYGPNPCGEIGMWPMMGTCACGLQDPRGIMDFCSGCGELICAEPGVSFCNLTEVNCAAMESMAHLYDTVTRMAFIGTLQASYTDFPYLGEVTEAIVRREALLGVGLTGMWDSPWVFDATVLSIAAGKAIEENKRVAELIGIACAARVTTIKPSGTSSLEMGGVGSGIHPRWSRRYIQRVTANKNEPQAAWFRSVNPHMVEVKPNGDWALLFPIECSDDAITVKGLAAMDHLEKVLLVYEHWIKGGTALESSAPGLTHNVSCTIAVREGELEGLLDRVWDERHRLAAMTFMPLDLDTRFRYAPRQSINSVQDEALWNNLIRLYRPVDWALFTEEGDATNLSSVGACEGNKCLVPNRSLTQ